MCSNHSGKRKYKYANSNFIFFFILSSCSFLSENQNKAEFEKYVINPQQDHNAYELLFQVYCNDKWITSQGYYYCQQPSGKSGKIRFVFPPVAGNFRASNCRENIIPPENFNMIENKTGWWIFKKRVFKNHIAEIDQRNILHQP